jgi:hypothetical protein
MDVSRCQGISFKGLVTDNVSVRTREAIKPLLRGFSSVGSDRYLHKINIAGENTSISLIDSSKGLNYVVRSIMLSTKYLENVHRQNMLIGWAKKYDYIA